MISVYQEKDAIDHCLLMKNIECNNSKDCQKDELCVLSGYSSDMRGNESMKSFCRSNSGGQHMKAEDAASFDTYYEKEILLKPIDELMESL